MSFMGGQPLSVYKTLGFETFNSFIDKEYNLQHILYSGNKYELYLVNSTNKTQNINIYEIAKNKTKIYNKLAEIDEDLLTELDASFNFLPETDNFEIGDDDDDEVNQMLAVSTIKGGIKVEKNKISA